MSEGPLTPRPAATVMLIRDTARRHQGLPDAAALRDGLVAGVMVFPGGGVDDRDRDADVAWFGPEPAWWAEPFASNRT